MKKLLIITLFTFFTFQSAYAEKCYLYVEKQGNINSQVTSQLAISLISQYIEKLESVPISGVGKYDCVYKLGVTESTNGLFVTISGRGLSAYGNSPKDGVDGLQQALLRSIFRAKLEIKDDICKAYYSVLKNDCTKNVIKNEAITKISSIPPSVEVEGVVFQITSCSMANQVLTCNYTIQSLGQDRLISIGRSKYSNLNNYVHEDGFKIFDDYGTEYWSDIVTLAKKESDLYVKTRLVMDIQTRGQVIFKKIDDKASNIALLLIRPLLDGKRITIEIRNIPISK